MIIKQDQLQTIKQILHEQGNFCITDDNVYKIYADIFPENTIVIKAGEDSKNLTLVGGVCEKLRMLGASRASTIVAVGGGVVGDFSGFCASIYMRGIKWINVPTTLLALTDSGIGGKTGVDLNDYKNMIGAFHFPEEIYSSTNFIDTLDEREFICGLGEVIKTACLNKKLFEFYAENEEKILAKDKAVMHTLIEMCARHKEQVVTDDPREKTILRKTLNYGHTIGHALEVVDKHVKSHGEYVMHGIKLELELFSDIIDTDFAKKVSAFVDNALQNASVSCDINAVINASLSDKKNENSKVSFVVCSAAGEYCEKFLTKEELTQKLNSIIK